MLNVLLTAIAIAAGASVLCWLLSFIKHHQGLNFLFNGNRFSGWSRFLGGATLLALSGWTVFATVGGALPAGLAVALIVVFTAITGGQLVKEGLRVLGNYPR